MFRNRILPTSTVILCTPKKNTIRGNVESIETHECTLATYLFWITLNEENVQTPINCTG